MEPLFGAELRRNYKTSTNCRPLTCGLLPLSGSRELAEWHAGLDLISSATAQTGWHRWLGVPCQSLCRERRMSEVSHDGWNKESGGGPVQDWKFPSEWRLRGLGGNSQRTQEVLGGNKTWFAELFGERTLNKREAPDLCGEILHVFIFSFFLGPYHWDWLLETINLVWGLLVVGSQWINNTFLKNFGVYIYWYNLHSPTQALSKAIVWIEPTSLHIKGREILDQRTKGLTLMTWEMNKCSPVFSCLSFLLAAMIFYF